MRKAAGEARRALAARARRVAGAVAAVQAGPPQPGYLMTGAWGEQALTPDARGWGWMVKSYVADAQRPLWNQAKEKLLNDGKVTSVTISTFNPRQYCEARKHWDYVWFEMQHCDADVCGRAEDDRSLPRCEGGRANDSYAGRTRSEHPEGDRPRRHGHHRSDG